MSCNHFISSTVLFLLLSLINSVALATDTVITVAGTGVEGYNGDNQAATAAQIYNPRHIAVDSSGNVFIADQDNHRIRKIDTSGNISTIAGTGTDGYDAAEEGGPAISAQLNSPHGIAVDSSGNVFIADTNNRRIRKVDTAGNISTIAGTGASGYDAADEGGPATSARLNAPKGVAVDSSGNVFIADTSNHRVRKVDISGNITTIAGTGTDGYDAVTEGGPATSAPLSQPVDIAVDSSGNLFIADRQNHRIRKVDTTGDISTVVGTGAIGGYNAGFEGGPATNAPLNYPTGITVDSSDNLLIADRSSHSIRKVDTLGNISTVAGIGSGGFNGDGQAPTATQFSSLQDVAVDSSGNLLISDRANQRIRKVMSIVPSPPIINTMVGTGVSGYSGDGDAAKDAQLGGLGGVAYDSNGNLFIADSANHRIRKVGTRGQINTIAGTGIAGFGGDGGAATAAQLNTPSGVGLDGSGNLYIVDKNNYRIRKIDSAGNISTIAGTGSSGFSGDGGAATAAQLGSVIAIAVHSSGNVFITDYGNQRIRKVDTTGIINTVAGTGTAGYNGDGISATTAELNAPHGIAVDSSGNLFIADYWNQRIRKVDTLGNISTVAGNGSGGFSGDGGAATAAQINRPVGITVSSSGELYIADTENSRIRKVDTDGNISTVAGTGTEGYNGDGGIATAAHLSRPNSTAIDNNGNLLVSDTHNYRLRKVVFNNTTPIVVDLGGTIERGQIIGGNLMGYDPDGDELTYRIVTPSTTGTTTLHDSSTGHFAYIHAPDVFGTESFTYQVNDGTVDSALATVTVTTKSCHFVVSSDQDSGEGTLRKAMAELCSTYDGTVTFASDMTINLSSEIPFAQNVTVDGSGYTITLDGGNNNRIFYTDTDNLTVIFKQLNFTNGQTPSESEYGGAVKFSADNTHLTVQNSTFSGNHAGAGGGALNVGANSTTLIEDSTFTQNTTDNSGGAFSMNMGQLTVSNSTFTDNAAVNHGGAIKLPTSSITTTIENVTFSTNQATSGDGGAIHANGDLAVKSSTFYNNTAAASGGALYLGGSTNSVENSSFVSNGAASGHSLYNNTGITTHVKNSLFAKGTGSAATECVGQNFSTNLNNLAKTGGCGMLNTHNLGLALGELADNGGKTLTIALQRGSPAIDAGDNASCLATDQRGLEWIDGDGDGVMNCDVGAYAYQDGGIPSEPSDLIMVNLTETLALLTWSEGLYTQQFRLFRTGWSDWVEQTDAFYTDTSIECGQVYTYQVTAKNAYGTTSPVSLDVSTLPCAISDITATSVSDTEIALDWTDLSTNLSGYSLSRDDEVIAQLAPDARNYADLDLSCATLYSYELTQQIPEGTGNTLTVSATTDVCPPLIPTAPTDLAATAIETQSVTLTWTDNSDNETTFVLLRDGTTIAALNTDSLNHQDSTVSCGQTYTYSLVARNEFGDSTASIITVTTAACPLEYTLILSVTGEGTISGCGASCQQVHPANTIISLTAEAAANWQFDSWSGACDVNGQVTLTANQACTAHFEPITVVNPNPVPQPTPTPSPPLLSPATPSPNNPNASATVSSGIIESGQSLSGGTLSRDTTNAGIISNLEVAPDITVTGGRVSGTITNNGTLNDVTVSQYSTVNGGALGGTITNQGTLNNVSLLAGSTVQEGTLSGIINSEGTLLNVSFEAGSAVHGGTVGGTIRGDADNPAYLGAVEILPGTVLENVHLSPTTQLPDDFVLGDNVTFAARPNNPTPQDFGIAPEQLASADANTLAELEPAAFSVLLPSDVNQLSPAALAGLDSAATAHLTPTAVAALTPEQFNGLNTEALAGLTAENLTGLTPEVIEQLSAEQVAALDADAVQDSEAAAEILTNLDADVIDEAVLLELVPETWSVEPDTGRLLPAVGATLGFRRFVGATLPDNVNLPALPDLSSALVIGGTGSSGSSADGGDSVPPLNNSLKESLTAADLADFQLSQSDTGVLLVEGTGEFEGVKLTFMPDNMIQVDREKVPVGVVQTEAGFYQMTTPEGYQFVMIPAPQDPLGLAALLGDTGSLQMNLKGDVWLNLEPTTVRRNLQVHQVVLFDPFIEQAPPETLPGVYDNRIVYPDNTAQQFYPTFPSPAIFISEALKIPGVRDVILTNDGSCKIVYEEMTIWAVPTGEVQRLPLAPGERVLPSVQRIPEGFLYILQDNTDILQTFFTVR